MSGSLLSWALSTGGLLLLVTGLSVLTALVLALRFLGRTLRASAGWLDRFAGVNQLLVLAVVTLTCGWLIDGTQGLLPGIALLIMCFALLLARP